MNNKTRRSYFEAFHKNLVPRTFQTKQYVTELNKWLWYGNTSLDLATYIPVTSQLTDIYTQRPRATNQ